MINKTLYGITKQQALVLLIHVNNDIATLGLLLWDQGKAYDIERGIYKAKKLKRFANQ